MSAVLVVEQDTLVRELMREHVEREGHVVCAVSSVRLALDVTGVMPVALALLNASVAAGTPPELLDALRERCANVVLVRPSVVAMTAGASETWSWSPFDLETLTRLLETHLAAAPNALRAAPAKAPPGEGPTVTRSGTFAAQRPEGTATGERFSVEALGALVLEATSGGVRSR